MRPGIFWGRIIHTLFLLLVFQGFSQALSESEPNGTSALSNQTFQDTINTGSIGSGMDNDDYFYSLPNDDGTIRMIFSYTNSGPSTNDFFVYVYNSLGGLIGTRFLYDVGVGGTDTLNIHCRQRDTVYFRISSNGQLNYNFYYQSLPSGTLDMEPNNTLAEATYFQPTDTVRGRMGYTGKTTDQNDYFFSNLPDDGTLLYIVEYTNTSGVTTSDFFSYVYNESGGLIGSKFSYDKGLGTHVDSIYMPCRASDTVFFRVSSNGCFSYNFRYELIPSGKVDSEPNNTSPQANSFLPSDTVFGRIGYTSTTADNDDYFFSVLPDDGTIRYIVNYTNTSRASTSDFFSYIYNKQGSLIGSSFKYDEGLGSHVDTIIIHCRQADTVYFRIASNGCYSYNFRYELIPSGPADAEPNNDANNANYFLPTDTVHGRIDYASTSVDNDDYFFSVLPDDGTLIYYVTYDNTSGMATSDFFSYIYNKQASLIGSGFNYDKGLGVHYDTITMHCRARDTVFFRVAANGCHSYSFRYEVVPSGQADVEPNNDASTATLFSHTDTVRGRIDYASTSVDNDDYFLSVLPDDGTLRYIVHYTNTSGLSTADFFSYIYSKNSSLIGSSFSYDKGLGSHTDTILIPCRASDTVYFRIAANDCHSYSFSYEMISSGQGDAEPNNTSPEAQLITFESPQDGRIGYSDVGTDQNDYFKIYNPLNSSFEIPLEIENTSGSANSDLFFYVYNSAGGLVGNSFLYDLPLGSNKDTLRAFCLPQDTFYIRVSSTGCFSYSFFVNPMIEQPNALIEQSRMGNEFGFMAKTLYTDSIRWDFGDGTTSGSRFPAKAFDIGVYDVILEARNTSCNLVHRDTAQITINGIEYYKPLRAGTATGLGFFNMRIFGGGLDTNAQVKLVSSGHTLTPMKISSPSRAELNLLFDLNKVPYGFYDVEVTLSTNEVFSFPKGFEIFEAEPGFQVETSISGPSNIRTGRWTNYNLTVTNPFARLANGVVVCVVVPKGVETNIKEILYEQTGKLTIKGDMWDMLTIPKDDFEQIYFQGSFDPNKDTISVDYDALNAVVDSFLSFEIDQLYGEKISGTVYPLYLPFIGANSSRQISFKVKSPSNGRLKLISYAWPFTLRQNPVSGETLDFIHDMGLQGAALAEYAPNPALRAVGKSAGWIDIGSQVAFTEYFDWYYGVNNADASFYGNQLLSTGAQAAGSLSPYGKKFDKATDKAKHYRGRMRGVTENIDLTEQIVKNGRLSPNMAKRISGDLAHLKKELARFDGIASNADKQAIMNAAQNYFLKRGIRLTTDQLGDLLFPDDTRPNRPDEIDQQDVRSLTSFDPNAIYGNTGYTSKRYLRKNESLDYMVTFENVDTAQAPAQIVRIELNLDPSKYDLKSTTLGNVTIAENTYFLEDDRREFFRDIDLRPDKNMIVRVNATLDTVTGDMLWQFTSLDPVTMDLIEDATDGFLPPNQNFPEGEGSVSFSTRMLPSIANEDSISTGALIFFDENKPINTGRWTNFIDEEAPTTSIVNSEVNDTTIWLNFNAMDIGSGLRNYYLHIKVDNMPWLPGFAIDSNAVPVYGEIGSTYQFYVEGQDSTGNREVKQPEAELTVSLKRTESDFGPSFTLYPNPTNSRVWIRSNGNFLDAELLISDAFGRKVRVIQDDFLFGRDIDVALGDLASGTYLFRFKTARGHVTTEKLILVSP